MRETGTPADAEAIASLESTTVPSLNKLRLQQVFALPVVEVSALAPHLARAISEAYHLAMTMLDAVRLASCEVRIALAKVVAFVAQVRLLDDRGVIDGRGIETVAKEEIDILSGRRPLRAP